jgi:phosphate transport system permease protein
MSQAPAQDNNLTSRHRRGRFWRAVFFSSTTIGILALVILLLTVINQSMGLVVIRYEVQPAEISARPLEELTQDELIAVLQDNLRLARFRTLQREQPLAERTRQEVYQLVVVEVLQPQLEATYNLDASLFDRAAIEAEVAEKYPDARLEFRSWLNGDFLTHSLSRDPLQAGISIPLQGSLAIILVTIVVAFPIGVGAAIYLEEYATKNRINRIIQTNIDNLAGVPSIVYGILGLALFVRGIGEFTSGAVFGSASANGRTVLSAGLTMALLILPVLIINAQAAFGLGATRWQTVWHHVLPAAMPGIMTGAILAVSRAIGETAPLILVGASSFINKAPDSAFSLFTAIPIQIYNWTSSSQLGFRNIAAAAIIVLLITLLTINALAILIRNRFSKRW